MSLVRTMLRWWAIWALIAAGLMLGAAHWFEKVEGLPPCPLCLKQREAYWAAIAVAAPAVVWTLVSRARGTPRLAAFFLFTAFGVGAFIAVFHAGGEQGWWALPATCTAVQAGPIDAGSLLDSLRAPQATPSCGEVAWAWAGLSMAGWNAVISAGLAILSLFAAARPRDARAPRLFHEP